MYLRKQKPKKYAFGDWLESQPQGYTNQPASSSNNLGAAPQATSDFSNQNEAANQALGVIPVVGGVSSAVHSVFDPIGEEAHAVDPNSGKFESKNKAAWFDSASSQFDPLTTGLNTLENPDATFVDKLASFTGMSAFTSGSLLDKEEERNIRELSQAKNKYGQANFVNKQQQKFQQDQAGNQYSGLSNFEFGGYLDGGGSVNGGRTYKGLSHEDSKYEGIPVDKNGEPSIMSGGETVGLTEGNEFKYTFKDKNTYIFSDKF